MDILKKLSIVGMFGTVLGAAPLVPSEMELAYSYQYPANQYSELIEAPDGHTMIKNPQPNFSDTNGDGKISVSVFKDKKGNKVYVQIDDAKYGAMGTKNGEIYNPKKSEYLSIFEAIAPPNVEAAISYNSGTTGEANPGTSVTFSHTVSGSNTLMIVGIHLNSTSDVVTGVTYNGVAATRSVAQVGALNRYSYVYSQYAPSDGAHNVVVSLSSSVSCFVHAESYAGVSQTGFPDSSNYGKDASGNYTATTSVVAANSWMYVTSRNFDQASPSPSSGLVRTETNGGYQNAWDSNGTVSTGVQSVTFTLSGGSGTSWIAVSFAPYADAGGSTWTGKGPQLMWFD